MRDDRPAAMRAHPLARRAATLAARAATLAAVMGGLLAAWLLSAAPGMAQEVVVESPVTQLDSLPPDSVTGPPVSPRGAFLRSMAVPGWGHALVGSYTRAGFYVAIQGGTAWMLVKTESRRRTALDLLELREMEADSRLRAQGLTPDSAALAVASDPEVVAAQELVEARGQQREDWVALGIAMIFLSGVDAYVSTHLADFPEPLEVSVAPAGEGRVEVGLSIPWRGPLNPSLDFLR